MTNKSLMPPVPEWVLAPAPVPYAEAVAAMNAHVDAMLAGLAAERIWLLEHPSVYTMGLSAQAADLVRPAGIPVVRTSRGGQITYHGPGQRVIYPMLDLPRRGLDIRCYVDRLEGWMIAALARLGVAADRRPGRVGLWVPGAGGHDDKLVAIGVRVRRGISLHGAAINRNLDLAPFDGIVPCGIREHGVTSLHRLGVAASPEDLDQALKDTFEGSFGTAPACRP